MNMSTRRSDFLSAITRLVENTTPPQQTAACTDALKREMDALGIGINLDYAEKDFQWASDEGHPLVERCMDWWDEVVSGIRYPVACCHVVTGTLPGGYVSHTAAAISVYDRDGKPVAHGAVEWADCCSAETDEECYTKFATAIYEKAADLGARSMFKFIDGMPAQQRLHRPPSRAGPHLVRRTDVCKSQGLAGWRGVMRPKWLTRASIIPTNCFPR